MRRETLLDVGRTTVKVSNLDKVMYPGPGFTKADVIDYYVNVSPVLLPHLKDRPITLKRYPDGVEGFHFYEKECPSHRPAWIRTMKVDRTRGGEAIHYCMINALPALVWAANLADLELHTFLHRAPAISKPTCLAFDLDPGAPAGLRACCEVALKLRRLFGALGLESYPKTSGSKGLQVYVPLNTPVDYERTKPFAQAVARVMEERDPGLVVSNMAKRLRRGKVLVDWSQNDDHKTTVCVYSLRAKESPTVSTPLAWSEVEIGARKPESLVFEAADVLRRIERMGDLFEPVLRLKQKLPAVGELGGGRSARRRRA
jgi:bifunctional non-homologous end joining protein LigD